MSLQLLVTNGNAVRSEELGVRSYTLRDSGTVRIFTSSTAERSPFSYKEKALMPLRVANGCSSGERH